MLNVTTARVSQHFSAAARARRRTLSADRGFTAPARTSLGETFAIGLGCDGYKPRQS